MSRAVWKYSLGQPLVVAHEPPQSVMMPSGAEIVHTEMQGGQLCMWAVVNPIKAQVPSVFIVCGTGADLPDRCNHVGSVSDDMFMWHVFEARP